MTFKACKYNCNTQIQWDTELSAFRETDGKLHDRKRCEGIRQGGNGNNNSYQQQQQQQQPQSQPSNVSSTMATYDVASTLNTILSHCKTQAEGIILINRKLEQLSEYYSGIYEFIRNQHKAEAEAGYDQDREDGLA